MTFNIKIFLMNTPAIVLGLVLFFGASVSAQMEASVENFNSNAADFSSSRMLKNYSRFHSQRW
jgi:hypothetical protein